MPTISPFFSAILNNSSLSFLLTPLCSLGLGNFPPCTPPSPEYAYAFDFYYFSELFYDSDSADVVQTGNRR
ncbi:MAG: hypothetical protein QM216_02005, partial [Bacillota bacterium]|nr:hypothetical protein [Bacillota bacterium]